MSFVVIYCYNMDRFTHTHSDTSMLSKVDAQDNASASRTVNCCPQANEITISSTGGPTPMQLRSDDARRRASSAAADSMSSTPSPGASAGLWSARINGIMMPVLRWRQCPGYWQ